VIALSTDVAPDITRQVVIDWATGMAVSTGKVSRTFKDLFAPVARR
jgi:hypothetical protein